MSENMSESPFAPFKDYGEEEKIMKDKKHPSPPTLEMILKAVNKSIIPQKLNSPKESEVRNLKNKNIDGINRKKRMESEKRL